MLLVVCGGGLGALCRYGFSLTAARFLGTRFPWGTLAANMCGCFLIGVAFALSDRTNILSPSARLFFMTGFLGALTTFSTYALESVTYLRAGSHIALGNFLLNNFGGGALVFLGFRAVHLWLRHSGQ
ncbi:MAG: fluoride efflux transporter CrcB [Desulfococcaceae bacterium]|jgi:CrcB protein|nr:fluoride efflux transporter CrcB [Desulfococcaceae bacterium]